MVIEYDEVLVHIGSFGRWQRLIFAMTCLVAIGNGFITLQQSFILYRPDYRCFVLQCDGDPSTAEYEANFARFALPFWNTSRDSLDDSEIEESSCKRYVFIEKEGEVEEENLCRMDRFNRTITGKFRETYLMSALMVLMFQHSSPFRGVRRPYLRQKEVQKVSDQRPGLSLMC